MSFYKRDLTAPNTETSTSDFINLRPILHVHLALKKNIDGLSTSLTHKSKEKVPITNENKKHNHYRSLCR